jgi:hypothetical protein
MNTDPIHIEIDPFNVEEFNGKTIAAIHVGKDRLGYDVIEVVCVDGSSFLAEEIGQTGQIVWSASFIEPDPTS